MGPADKKEDKSGDLGAYEPELSPDILTDGSSAFRLSTRPDIDVGRKSGRRDAEFEEFEAFVKLNLSHPYDVRSLLPGFVSGMRLTPPDQRRGKKL